MKLPLRTFCWGLGFAAVSFVWAVYNVYVPLILHDRFQLGPSWLAFFMGLDNLCALLVQPVAGAWSDRVRSPWGRRLPFLLLAIPVSALAFSMLPLASVLPLYALCSTSLLISMALWRTPLVAMVADETPSHRRSPVNGLMNWMGGAGAIVAYFAAEPLAQVHPALPFWAAGLALLVTVSGLFLTAAPRGTASRYTPETRSGEEEALETAPPTQPGLLEPLQDMAAITLAVFRRRNRSLAFLLCSLFLLMLGYSSVEGFFTLYCQRHLGLDTGASTRMLGQMSLVFVLCALPCGYWGARVGRKNCVLGGTVGMSALLGLMHALPPAVLAREFFALPALGTCNMAGVLLMLMGLCWALVIVHALPMALDLRQGLGLGSVSGLYYLFTTGAGIVGPALTGWLIHHSGQSYNAVTLSAPVAMLGAALLLMWVRGGEGQGTGTRAGAPDQPLSPALAAVRAGTLVTECA